ncbi:MAG: type IV pilin N-terminal domain-containing protein [Candidatus Syntropharchaeales archaeon]
MRFIRDENAVSEIVGEILMIGVVVISFGLVTTFVYTYLSGPDISPGIDVTGIADDTLDTIYLKHSGGEWIGENELKVILRINNTTYQYNCTDEFRLGDVIEINTSGEYGLDLRRGEEVTILLIHVPTGQIISSGELGYRAADCSEDSTPPSSVTNLRNTTFEPSHIIWAWDNPADEDYSHAEVYIDGIYQGTTSASWYNATGFDSGTSHTISLRTVDTCGNVDATWVNDSAITSKAWWNVGWSYRRSINITSSAALTDYQILLDIDYDSDMQSDFDDLRFVTEDGDKLSYWIENRVNDTNADVWVKVPSIAAGNTIIYMYYGNAGASSESDGEATFEFFDDFDDPSLSNWQLATSNYVVGSSALRINAGAVSIKNPFTFSLNDGYALEGRIKYHNVNSHYSGTLSAQSSHYTQGSNGGADATNLYMRRTNSRTLHRWTGDGSTTGYNCGSSDVFSSGDDVWYILGAEFNSVGVTLTRDRTVVGGPYGCGWNRNIIYISLGAFHGSASYDIQDTSYDWVLIRKYASSEPTYTVGDEEEY